MKSTGSNLKRLVDSRALRAVVLVAVLLLAAYTAFFRLGLEDWHTDEPIYRIAGLAYVQEGDFSVNQEHPFLAKYILGFPRSCPAPRKREWFVSPPQRPRCLPGLSCSPLAGGRRATGSGYWRWPCGPSLPLPWLSGETRPL